MEYYDANYFSLAFVATGALCQSFNNQHRLVYKFLVGLAYVTKVNLTPSLCSNHCWTLEATGGIKQCGTSRSEQSMTGTRTTYLGIHFCSTRSKECGHSTACRRLCSYSGCDTGHHPDMISLVVLHVYRHHPLGLPVVDLIYWSFTSAGHWRVLVQIRDIGGHNPVERTDIRGYNPVKSV